MILTKSDLLIIIVGIMLSLSIFLYGFSTVLNNFYLSLDKSLITYNWENYGYAQNGIVLTSLFRDELTNEERIYLCFCPEIKCKHCLYIKTPQLRNS